MFEFGESQKKRRHKKATSYDLTESARVARHNRLVEKRAARAAEKKRIKNLTSSVRGVKTKQRKFRELKKEVLSELRATLKACETQEAKLKERATQANTLLQKLSSQSEELTAELSIEWIDLSNIISDLTDTIEMVKETER